MKYTIWKYGLVIAVGVLVLSSLKVPAYAAIFDRQRNGAKSAEETISGNLINEDTKQPVVGASIKVKGKAISTASDKDGHFVISAGLGETLVITHVGFVHYEIKVADVNLGTITLKVSNSGLDEVQIVGYGETSKRFNTGNTATVTAAEIAMQPVGNPLLALVGRVPGLVINQSSGFSGTGVINTIQGQKQLPSNADKGSDDPLFVIDGITYPSQLLEGLSSVLGQSASRYIASGDVIKNGSGSPLSFINPADIESIDILKDADATAIYGSKGADGVIIITTKKGKAGKTVADFNLQTGTGEVAHMIKLLNTTQYLQMRHQALANDNITIDPQDGRSFYDINGTWDTTRYTDWQKTLIGGTARYTDIEGSISGGSENTQFLVGTSYHRETTALPGDFNDRKIGVRFSLNHVSPDKKFRLSMSAAYMGDNNYLPAYYDFMNLALNLAPDAPPLYKPDGTLNWQPDKNNTESWVNPLAYLKQTDNSEMGTLTSSATLSYQLLSGLLIKCDFGYNRLQSDEVSIVPLSSLPPSYVLYGQIENSRRVSSFNDGSINTWQVSPQLTYKRDIGKGRLDALVGMSQEENSAELEMRIVDGFINDLVMDNVGQAKEVQLDTKGTSIYKYNGIFGRVSYNLDEKYLFNITGRRDGSSRYGDDNKFHTFGAAGLGWIFSKEDIIANSMPFLSFGKVKASYGVTGSDQINDYQDLATYQTVNSFVNYSASGVPQPVLYQGSIGLTPNNLPNPYLQWELDKKLNLGLDLGFFKDRVLLAADYYDNRASNQVQTYFTTVVTGVNATGLNRNSPAVVRNWGWEFTATTINIQNKDLRWTSSFNLTVPKNKLISFPDISQIGAALYLKIGEPVTARPAYHALGIDPATGNFMVQGADGKPTAFPNYLTDEIAKINTDPTLYGGIENSFQYKGFGLDFLFQFAKRKDFDIVSSGITGTPGNFFSTNTMFSGGNQPAAVLNNWKGPGTITSLPAYTTLGFTNPDNWSNYRSSDAGLKDASFIRLKNVSLSWTLPKDWSKKAGLDNIRLYVQGQNIFTITKYNGYDPEVTASGTTVTLPLLRVITMGAQITL